MTYTLLLLINLSLLYLAVADDKNNPGFLQGLSTGLTLLGSLIFWISFLLAKTL